MFYLILIPYLDLDVLYVWLAIAFSVVVGALVVWRYASHELAKKEALVRS
ncbi:MAG: hypothetical protein U9N52_03710 [Campylobacterota bacterium]|nr:hypothetical protein [Campylobacterota bacterium]